MRQPPASQPPTEEPIGPASSSGIARLGDYDSGDTPASAAKQAIVGLAGRLEDPVCTASAPEA